MRTKPIITVLALLSLTVSCCKHDDISVEDRIFLGAGSISGTKAVITDKESLVQNSYGQDKPGFGVFGYKTSSSNQLTLLFDNTEVKPDLNETGTDWSYSPTRYWDSNPTVSYQFIAYWPRIGTSSGTEPYVSQSNKILTINDIPNWQDADIAQDFLTAKALGHYKSDDPYEVSTFYNNNGKVSFSFYHILAKLVIKAYYEGVFGSEIAIKKLILKPDSENPSSVFLAQGQTSDYSQPFNEKKRKDEPYYGASFNDTEFDATTSDPGTENPFGSPAKSANGPDGRKLFPYGTSTAPHAPISDDAYWEGEGYDLPEPDVICEQLMVPCDGWQNLELYVEYSIDGVDQTPATIKNISFGTTLSYDSGSKTKTYAGRTFGNRSYSIVLKFNSANSGIEVQSIIVEDWVVDDANNFNTDVYNW